MSLNYSFSYDIQARAIDKLSSMEGIVINKVFKPVFDWGKSDFNFNVPVNFDGAISGAGITGTWTPIVSGTSSYNNRYGWYTKIGKVITIGWYVTGYFNSTKVKLTITGLKYINGDALAAGGGILYNALSRRAGEAFVGWVIPSNSARIEVRTANP